MSAEAVLFDAPGPKARVRYAILAVIGGLLIVGLLWVVVRGLANPQNNQLAAEKWTPFLTSTAWTAYLLPGLWATLQGALISVVLSCVFGLLLGVGRLSSFAPVRVGCSIFVEVFRAVPVLMMMLFAFYFGLFVLRIFGEAGSLFGVVVGLTFYNSSVIAELIRSGVTALPRGQREAGLALGLTEGQAMTSILLPQAITAMLPSLVSQLVVILKDTALGYIILYPELIRAAQNLGTTYANTIPALLVAAVMFILINYGLTRVARALESRLQRRGRKTIPADPAVDPALTPGGVGASI